jgi:Protein of unknown function (DUF 659)
MAASRAMSLFFQSVSTGQQAHTGEWVAADIERVMSKHTDSMFSGAFTDNTSANKKAWVLLKAKFPGRFFQGCTSHGLHLMVKDIFGPTKTKKAGALEATYPAGYPFENLLSFAADCKNIVNFFHNPDMIKDKLRSLQTHNNLPMLVRSVPTRWRSPQQGFCTLLKSEPHLPSIVNERDFLMSELLLKRLNAFESKT